MSSFNCTRCGALMEAPAAGTRAACPSCGQLFETPADPAAPPPAGPVRGRPESGYADEGGYGRRRRAGHSGLGIASFIIGLVVVVLCLLVVILAAALSASRPSHETADAMALMAGVAICGGLAASLVGLGLGVGGVFQEDRNRTLAVVGLALNGLVLLGGVILLLIGMAVSHRY